MPIQTKEVDYTHDGTNMRGYLAFDDAGGPKRPGVLVCHEWWGLNDHVRRRALQMAEWGYVGLALDMFGDGKVARDHHEAGKLMNELMTNADARGRVQAAVDALTKQPQCDAHKIAAIGYCMGGSMALNMLRAGMPLLGVAALHAGLKAKSPAGQGSIKARVLVCTGADDPGVPAADREKFTEEMTRAGADWQMIIYGGTRHGFTNPDADKAGLEALRYNANSDRRAHEAVKDFFAEVFCVTSASIRRRLR